MNRSFRLGALFGVCLLTSALNAPVKAAEIKVLSSNGLKEVLNELTPEFERATSHKLVIKFDSSTGVKRAIDNGAEFDLAIAAPEQIEGLTKSGKVAQGTAVPLARVGIGVAIRAGTSRPDIGSTEAFKQAMLNARSIMHNKEGASGKYIAALFERLGLAEQLKEKMMQWIAAVLPKKPFACSM